LTPIEWSPKTGANGTQKKLTFLFLWKMMEQKGPLYLFIVWWWTQKYWFSYLTNKLTKETFKSTHHTVGAQLFQW